MPSKKRPVAPPALMNTNQLRELGDLQHALADAAMLGYRDNANPEEGARPRRTGPSIAEAILVPGSWKKSFERSLKSAYLAGYDFRYQVEGVKPPRERRKAAKR
jgi:hypothetical protein